MEKIIFALELQHGAITLLRARLAKSTKETKELTEEFLKLEEIYEEALMECGKLNKER